MKEEDFKRFIDRVEKLKEERSDNFSQKELEEVATELGLSVSDLEAASKRATDCRTRAQEFIDRNLADEALGELKEAIALAPWELETFFLQALAHEIKWKDGNKESLHLAMDICRQVIEKDSTYEPAYDCMARLKVPPSNPAGSSKKKTNIPTLFMICVAAIISWNFQNYSQNSTKPAKPEIGESRQPANGTVKPVNVEVQPTKVPEPIPTKLSEPIVPTKADTGKSKPVLLKLDNGSLFPVTLVPKVPAPGISLQSYDSELKYGHHSLKIKLKNVGPYEYSKLATSLVYLDKEGKTIDDTRKLTLLDTYQGIIRPGDSFNQNTTLSMKGLSTVPSTVNMVVRIVKNLKAPESYGDSRQIEFLWKTEKPSHLNLSGYIRSQQTSEISYLKGVTTQSILEVAFRNTGSGSFRTLAYMAVYEGKNKEETFSGTRKLLVSSSSLPLIPGEIRVNRIYDKLSFEPQKIIISIVEIQ